jgi:hypothetical protein
VARPPPLARQPWPRASATVALQGARSPWLENAGSVLGVAYKLKDRVPGFILKLWGWYGESDVH